MSERNLQHEPEDLAEYVASGSQAAFRRVVEAWLPLVMGTALRRTGHQREMAEDIAQIVFSDLARRAKSVRKETVSGWLHKHTCFTASKMVRSERRRRLREVTAAETSPGPACGDAVRLDDLLLGMAEMDREAVLLRFLEGRTHEEVAQALGISRAAAQKRSERGLERLRLLFRAGLTAGGVAAVLAPPVAEGADLTHRIAGTATAAAAAGVKALPFLAKPLAGAVWGAAAAITLSVVPLALAWRDYAAASRAAAMRPAPSRVAAGTVPGTIPTAAQTMAFQSPDAVVTALLAAADRYGIASAGALGRRMAILAEVPAGWIHEVAMILDRRLPPVIRGTHWHTSLNGWLAAKWQPRRVPEDLIAVWKVFGEEALLGSLFNACAAADLPATRRMLERWVEDKPLGVRMRQPGEPHGQLARAVIVQALKDSPGEVAAIFDRVPRVDFVPVWEFPGTKEIAAAAQDSVIRQALGTGILTMKDERRRRVLESILINLEPEPQRRAKVELMPDPVRRAEAATAVAGLDAESLQWWEQQVPPHMRPALAGVLAERNPGAVLSTQDPALTMAWAAQLGETTGGAEFDHLRSYVTGSILTRGGAAGPVLADMANRTVSPEKRVRMLLGVLEYNLRGENPWGEKWMQEHLSAEEQTAVWEILGRQRMQP